MRKRIFEIIETAKENEMISFALKSYALQEKSTVGAEIKVNYYRPDDGATIIDSLSFTDYYYPSSISLNPEKAKETRVVQLNSCYGLEQKDIEKMKEIQALMDIGVDFAINLIGTFWKPVGLGLSIFDLLLNSNYSSVSSQVANYADDSTAISVGITLYDALLAYMDSYDDFVKTKEECEKGAYSSAFYTCYYNTVDEKVKCYAKMDDLGIIRAIQNWSRDGLKTIYKETDMDIIAKCADDIKTNIDTSLKGCYDQAVIDKAWNTILNGYSNDSDAGTYMSILDIPEEVFSVCVLQINDEISKYSISDVQSTIATQRSDYIDPDDHAAEDDYSDESDG